MPRSEKRRPATELQRGAAAHAPAAGLAPFRLPVGPRSGVIVLGTVWLDAEPSDLVFDRDTILSAEVVRVVRSMSIEPTRTSYRSPWQNGVAERFVGDDPA